MTHRKLVTKFAAIMLLGTLCACDLIKAPKRPIVEGAPVMAPGGMFDLCLREPENIVCRPSN